MLTQTRRPEIDSVRHRVTAAERAARNGHLGAVVWLTGLSASGKSTVAMLTDELLFEDGYQSYVLDGDNLRHGINVDLGFDAADRHENTRRVGEVAALFADAGFVVFAALISPFRTDRMQARAVACRFYEVFVKASLDTCERRDPRGLYKLARAGGLSAFTGVSAPYEVPLRPELVLDTERLTAADAALELGGFIKQRTITTSTSMKRLVNSPR